MLALLDAGLSLTESLEVQSTKAQRSGAKQVLTDVLTAVRCGLPFSAALAECPDVFSPLFIAIVKASEQTGDLAETLRSYITYQQQADTVRNRVASAAIYPLLLIGVGALVIAFLLVYVIPRFSRIYEDLGKDLPWSSRLMISWSHFVSDYGSWMLMVILCLCGGAAWLAMAHATRATAERIIWRMPAIGEKTRLYQLARFTRTLAMLTRGGVPFVSALGLVSDLLRQPALHAGLQQAKQSISEGKAISVAFAAESLATEVGVRLLAVAEHSGSMGASLERIAQLYDDELARWVDRASKLFEPILMLVIGAAIGLIVLLMYMPIFELANSIQ
ncbi:type II secretion system F family protein [Massilia horti]|nr:type II secretion system F family protein [Massilia horti]